MEKASPSSKPAAFVAGMAIVFLIIAAWASLRLALALYNGWSTAPAPQARLIPLTALAYQIWLALHLVIAVASLGAALALRKFKAWARSFFIVVAGGLGGEALAFGLYFAFVAQPEDPALKSLQLATGLAMALMGSVCIMLMWKLWRDPGIKALF